jgi:adenosylcobyric acid synthase
MLSRIANFDDMDPLRLEPNVELGFVPPGQFIPQDVDAIILPGTKSALGDLAFLRAQGWDHDIIAFARNGGRVTGICGGYQLLGHWIHDPDGVDGEPGSAPALGLLDVTTRMYKDKQVQKARGHCSRSHSPLTGYEIHSGLTNGSSTEQSMSILNGHADGAISSSGRIEGTYLHGLFANDEFRRFWLNGIKDGISRGFDYEAFVDKELDSLADGLEASLDVDALLNDARKPLAAS